MFSDRHNLSGKVKFSAAHLHYKQITKGISIKPYDRILEIGCGDGHLFKLLAKRTGRMFGIDINKLLLKKINSSFLLAADAAYLPFTENSFNIVIYCHSLEHMANLDKVLCETNRIMHADGFFIIIYPYEPIQGITLIGNIQSWPEFWKVHHHKFTPKKLSDIVCKYSFFENHSHLYLAYNPMFISVFQKKGGL